MNPAIFAPRSNAGLIRIITHPARVCMPTVIIDIIVGYAQRYVFAPWVDIDKINWEWLMCNPRAVDYLEENPHRIDWMYLSENPAAMECLPG